MRDVEVEPDITATLTGREEGGTCQQHAPSLFGKLPRAKTEPHAAASGVAARSISDLVAGALAVALECKTNPWARFAFDWNPDRPFGDRAGLSSAGWRRPRNS
ncbi:unnamed protein product [Prorocentrum cordatum]|nr:unnamed protein product [Polarella glacialis]